MKILFYRYGSICEPDLLEQFVNIGFEVDTITEEINRKNLTASEQMRLVQEKLQPGGYSFVFSINYFPIISQVCEIYRILYICWTVDAPIAELFSQTITNDCNRLFVFDKKQSEFLSNYTSRVEYLPLATNVPRWDRVCAKITNEDYSRYSSDISFVGSTYVEKDPYRLIDDTEEKLRSLFDTTVSNIEQGTDISLIGEMLTKDSITLLKDKYPKHFWDGGNLVCDADRFLAVNKLLLFHYASLERIEMLTGLSKYFCVDLYTNSSFDTFREYPNVRCHKGVATLTEMPKVFRLSKINLNLTIKSIEKGLPLRIWDIMGCGGFLMTDYKPELEELLVPGVDYEDYVSMEELVEKCAFYLKHEDERLRIAQNGYEKVSKYHTYINRMPSILGTLLR